MNTAPSPGVDQEAAVAGDVVELDDAGTAPITLIQNWQREGKK